MIFANPFATAINLAPSPYAHVLTRTVPKNPMQSAASYNPSPSGYVNNLIPNGIIPQPPARALPSPVDVRSLVSGLPSLFDIYHG